MKKTTTTSKKVTFKKQGNFYEVAYYVDGERRIKYVSAGDDSNEEIENYESQGYKVVIK